MRIALISLYMPTPDNRGGASALPFHILNVRDRDSIKVDIFTWNYGGIPHIDSIRYAEELNCGFNRLKTPHWFRAMQSRAATIGRLILPVPPIAYFKLPKQIFRHINSNYDAVWIYGEELAGFSRLFPTKPVVITTPDCEAMYYARLLSIPSKLPTLSSLIRYATAYSKYLRLARSFERRRKVKYHLVGKADSEFLRLINPGLDTHFIRHPHYNYIADREIRIADDRKLKILVAGRNDIYMLEAAADAFKAIRSADLSRDISFTFLGKGWEAEAKKLKAAGYEVEMLGFVEDYARELCRHDIQLTPIITGTGTKGKVLDALANGLLVIGTERALENIAGENGRDFIRYSESAELIDWLLRLAADHRLAENIARSGRQTVLEMHDRFTVANQFFDLFDTDKTD